MDQLDEIKRGNRTTWASGDFDEIASLIWDVGEDLVQRMDIGAGETVLDVGAGTGNAAIPAAAAGADVIASDLTPELFEAGRRRAGEEGVELQWVEADAEALPFDDGSFDVVLSTFGHMFAPRHRVAAGEIARVTRPGGRIGLCCWDPEATVGGFFRTVGSHMPPPPDVVQPPPMWGNPDHAREMFDGSGIELEFERGMTRMDFPDAVTATDHYAAKFGPVVMARQALEPEGRWQALHDDLVAFFDENSERTADGLSLPAEYLVIVGRRPA
jgi:SAM-dependent methyltransferase